jgi:hypothetical protein
MATIPSSGDMPFIRTDFSNDAAWHEVVARAKRLSPEGFQANLQIIDPADFSGIEAPRLRGLAADTNHAAIFVADEITMTEPERHVLCIDLLGWGRSFRVVPEELRGLENNLSIANMDFDEFADSVEDDGVFRGF